MTRAAGRGTVRLRTGTLITRIRTLARRRFPDSADRLVAFGTLLDRARLAVHDGRLLLTAIHGPLREMVGRGTPAADWSGQAEPDLARLASRSLPPEGAAEAARVAVHRVLAAPQRFRGQGFEAHVLDVLRDVVRERIRRRNRGHGARPRLASGRY